MLTKSITPVHMADPATEVRILSITIAPGQEPYASARVGYYTTSGSLLITTDVTFTEEELSTWGDDDTVLLNLALAKLGVA